MYHSKLYLYLIVIILTVQCSESKREYSEGEMILMKKMQAEDASVTLFNSSSTTNGKTTYENFLLVELYKPKYLLDINFNQSIYKSRCEELTNFLLDSLTYDPKWKFDELRFKIIEHKKFLIFRGEKSKTETFKIH